MRYFFHTVENGKWTPDDEGIELEDDEAARVQATQFLVEVAADLIPYDGGRRFGVEVQDEGGLVVAAIGFALSEGRDIGT